MNLENQIKASLVAAVERAQFSREPFWHLVMKEAFPSGIYQAMQELMPATGHFKELRHKDAIQPDGTSSRLEIRLENRDLASLPDEQRELWEAVAEALKSSDVESAIRNRLKEGLIHRFGERWDQVVVKPTPILVRDVTGYRIGIHRDISKKAITVQFYLPADSSQDHLGTSFYQKDDKGKFVFDRRMEFSPNSGYAFAVTDNSWHGVDDVASQDGARNSLMLIYYLEEGQQE